MAGTRRNSGYSTDHPLSALAKNGAEKRKTCRYARMLPTMKAESDMAIPSQNFSSNISGVFQPIDFSMPISFRSSADRPDDLSQAKMTKDSMAESRIMVIIPPRQSKRES